MLQFLCPLCSPIAIMWPYLHFTGCTFMTSDSSKSKGPFRSPSYLTTMRYYCILFTVFWNFSSFGFNGTTPSKISSILLTILSQSSLLAPISLLVLDVSVFLSRIFIFGLFSLESKRSPRNGDYFHLSNSCLYTRCLGLYLHHKSNPVFRATN